MSQLQSDQASLPNNQLIGLASLTAHAFSGADLTPIAEALKARIEQQPDDAAARMDLATINFLFHAPEVAMQWQQQAMDKQARYSLLSTPENPQLRMLVMMGAGGLMDNLPLEFLLEGSNIAIDLHYMQLGDAMPTDVADYDLLFIAVGESDKNTPLLQQLAAQFHNCPIPVINRPEHIMHTTREGAAAALQQVTGIEMPQSVRLSRTQMKELCHNQGGTMLENSAVSTVGQYLAGQDFPIIARPVESHAGHGLERLDQPTDINTYLAERPEQLFYISRFVNYASSDGQFRKYRIVLVEGQPLVCHLAISSHWLVHYLNAEMTGNADKCSEEAHCMANFDQTFGLKHKQAFATMYEKLQLEYLIIDCAETNDGQLLVFEVDTSAIVHAMDSLSQFPYKRPQMHKIFRAFQDMLVRLGAS